MIKLQILASLLVVFGKCQVLRDEERPTRYVLPYSSLTGEELDLKDEQYYEPNRRAERIPATAYRYEEAEEEHYQQQVRPKSRQKIESESLRYQASAPSHKDYEEIMKNNHLARLRVAAKKQFQPQVQTQQPVEQYLKEVNPTTKTTYQRQSNFLRYNEQNPALKEEHSEETLPKQQSYRYVLQPEQKSFRQYQYEAPQESPKPVQPKPPHFNLVAFQNALITRQKLQAAENQEETPAKSTIYVAQTVPKKTKKLKTSSRQPASATYDYYPQITPQQRATYAQQPAPVRYQQGLRQGAYAKNEANFPNDETSLYPEQKELEYQTEAPTRQNKQRPTRLPRRKSKYQTEEIPEEYQPSAPKYQQEEQTFDYPQSTFKNQEEPIAYRRPASPTKVIKYEDQVEIKEDYLYQPKYQRENIPRRQQQEQPRQQQQQYVSESEVRPSKYFGRQQYQEETKQLPQYRAVDLAYQPTAEIPVRQIGRGPSVSYRQPYPHYQYDRRHFITPTFHPKTRHHNSIEYQQEELYSTENKPSHSKTLQIIPSTSYNYQTRSNVLKLDPVQNFYELEEASNNQDTTSTTKFKPENITKMKGLRYPRKPKKQRTTYLNGQLFQEEVRPFYQRYLTTQSSTKSNVILDQRTPFLILVYDE